MKLLSTGTPFKTKISMTIAHSVRSTHDTRIVFFYRISHVILDSITIVMHFNANSLCEFSNIFVETSTHHDHSYNKRLWNEIIHMVIE